MGDKLGGILSSILDIEESVIDDTSSPETIEAWDSLQHLNLILAIEAAFNVSLTPEEMTQMFSSVADIKQVLVSHDVTL